MEEIEHYKPLYPISYPVDERVKEFISRFYAISDDKSQDEQWVRCFDSLAQVNIGDKSAWGTEEIRKMRKRMWEKVAARKHLLLRVYPVMFYPETSYGGDESRRPAAEYMIEGKVLTIGWHNFESRETSWAAHAILVEEQGELKYRFYQVCLSEHGRHGLDVSVGDRLRVFARRWLGPVLLVAALDVLYHKFLA